ncbi:hypothetical protein CYMTET_28534 [Cymbomonas tetramitiformis]|uniref:Ppx/GppA phosphatase N-terminal domain-containing protein n=1 Tax=Cymbomonas tetramitiformis TaxID=36881 RepID=A0AAE0FNB0_9CHLO|nr:hypothetical protein CYMTET_28534 [Cymbomonas tetramitiformis]
MSAILAALDVGSGASKLEVAKVDTTIIPWTVVGESLFAKEQELKLASDLKSSENNTISAHIIDRLFEVLKNFKKVASDLGATEISAAATAVFRLADNAPEVLKRIQSELGIRVRVISQEEEGEIGFLTAATQFSCEAPDLGNLVAWDSGGASFQLTALAEGLQDIYEVEPPLTVQRCTFKKALIDGVFSLLLYFDIVV